MARAGAHTQRAHAFGPSLQLALHVTKWSSGYALGDLVGLGDSLDRDWRVRVRRDLGAAASPTRAGVLLEEVLGISGADLATTWVWVRDFADWAARLACLLRIDVRALGEVRRYLGFTLGGEDCSRAAADLLGPLVTVLSMLRNAMPDPLAASERSRSPRGRRGAVPAGAQLAQERPLVPAWRADAIAQRGAAPARRGGDPGQPIVALGPPEPWRWGHGAHEGAGGQAGGGPALAGDGGGAAAAPAQPGLPRPAGGGES